MLARQKKTRKKFYVHIFKCFTMEGHMDETSTSGESSNSEEPRPRQAKVYYVWANELLAECDRLPAVPGRASMVHELISSYGLLQKLTVVKWRPATELELREFHAESYVQHLRNMAPVNDDYEVNEEDEEVGIGYDCAPVAHMFRLACTLAGGTVTAVLALLSGARVAINWCGGWHHAQRFEAEGFCYVNDIVVGIEKLRRRFPKVLYLDLDVHHGNAVEDAYSISKTVFTLSFHKCEPGFYPGTGSVHDVGALYGKGYSCNFPFKDGFSDESLLYAFDNIFPIVTSRFQPDAIVVQCGADVLAGDPLGGANVTTPAVCHCIRSVLRLCKPTILLGGGGYKKANAARLWTSITAEVLDTALCDDIPDNEFFTEYGPGYDLEITPTNKKDYNSVPYLNTCIHTIRENLDRYLPVSGS